MKNEKGFTLIELVVSIAVLSIIIVPFFGIFTNAAKLDMRSEKDLTANYLAQQLVAEAKEDPMGLETSAYWDKTVNGNETIFATKNGLPSPYSEYDATVTYEPKDITTSKGAFTILNGQNPYDATISIKFDCSNKDLTSVKLYSNDEEIAMFIVSNNSDGNIGELIYHNEIKIVFFEDRIELQPKNAKDDGKFGYTFSLVEGLNLSEFSNVLFTAEIIDGKEKDNNLSKVWLENKSDLEKITVYNLDIHKNGGLTVTDLTTPPETEILSSQIDVYSLEVEIFGFDPVKTEHGFSLKKIISVVQNK